MDEPFAFQGCEKFTLQVEELKKSIKIQLSAMEKSMEIQMAAIERTSTEFKKSMEIQLATMERTSREFKKTIEIQLAAMKETSVALSSHLEVKRKNVVPLKFEFPLESEKELHELEKKIRESPAKYIENFRIMVSPQGLDKNFERFFTRELIMTMNYAGGPGKIGLETFSNINNALFEATRIEGRNFRDYIKTVREAFGKAKNRAYKAKSKAKKN